MKMTNMTAVEWLVQQMCGKHTEAWHEEIQQALEMEREQIQNAHLAGQNPQLRQTDVISRYLIYANDYITWNEKISDWNNNDEFTGTYLDAHEYARKKYGKKYVMFNY